jgi:transposase
VRETLEPGVIVQVVADRHGVSTGQLYTWRKQMLATAMAGFTPVEVVPDPPQQALPAPPAAPATVATAGSMEIVLPTGASVRVTGAVDPAMLRMVLTELGGR